LESQPSRKISAGDRRRKQAGRLATARYPPRITLNPDLRFVSKRPISYSLEKSLTNALGQVKTEMKHAELLLFFFLLASLSGCSMQPRYTPSAEDLGLVPKPGPPPPITNLKQRHVFLIVLENRGLATLRNDRQASFLNSLLPKNYAVATNYFAVGHNSLDNYIAMISGQEPNCLTRKDCSLDTKDCMYPTGFPNLADQLPKGFTWKAYMESMTTTCQTSDTHPYLGFLLPGYATRHNPFLHFTDVRDDPTCPDHIVPYPRLQEDIDKGQVPNFSLIVPNTCNDAHNDWLLFTCQLRTADEWLQKEVPKIVKAFGDNDVLFITFDEAETTDKRGCCYQLGNAGGKVILIAVTPYSPKVYEVTGEYNHYSLLRTIEDLFGIAHHLGHADDPGVLRITELGLNFPPPGNDAPPPKKQYEPAACTQ
jgi:hypothetical protein